MNDAALVMALANARGAKRPTNARRVVVHDALADAGSADALLDSAPPRLEALNALAARESAIQALERHGDGNVRAIVRPKRAASAAMPLVTAIRELSELEASRLRRCARPECSPMFYDISRSATQRWPAERTCGLRERQRRHRAQHAA